MLNRLFIMVMAIGVFLMGWSYWQMNASSGGVVVDKDRTQEISEEWDQTRFTEGYVESVVTDAEEHANAQSAEAVEAAEEREYAYEAGAPIGELIVPKLESFYEVYWGTDDDTLKQGVGYHEGDFTTPPDGLRHTVLSGHRDTVFRELGELEEGDRLYLNFEDKVYEYQIREIWITDAEDRTVIVDKDIPTLTLTTCYPFSFLGAAPDRYIIQAELINISESQ